MHHQGSPPISFSTQNLLSTTDFVPLALVATFPNLLCVRNSLPVGTVAELVAFAKANPRKLNFASTGIGTTPHLAGEMLKRMAGIDFATVHYRGRAPALNDLLAGAVDAVIDNTASIVPHARAGSVRPLGVSPSRAGRWHRILHRSPRR